MATLTLKNVPEGLVKSLKVEAKINRRSLNQETLKRLEDSLTPRGRSVEETIASLKRLHARMEGIGPITGEFIQSAKVDGRP
ncbi:MAG: Arc family DNA-binding protein [Acidobacteriota bacterium]